MALTKEQRLRQYEEIYIHSTAIVLHGADLLESAEQHFYDAIAILYKTTFDDQEKKREIKEKLNFSLQNIQEAKEAFQQQKDNIKKVIR